MADDVKTTLQFDADITDFKAATREATQAIKLANSEFAAVSSSMDDWSASTDGLTAKIKQLSTVHQAEQRKLDVLKTAYEAVAREQGENSTAAKDLAVQINNQQAKVNRAEKDISAYETKLGELESTAGGAAGDIKKAGDAAKQAGEDAKESSDGWTIVKDVIADFIKDVVQNAIDTLFGAAEATREYRREMAQLAQNAADSGHSMDAIKGKLSEISAVTGDTSAAMEGLNMLMASGLDADGISYIADTLSGAALKFDGLSFEGIAEGLQETLSVGEAVGPFAEMIERTGADLKLFNAGLHKCTTDAEKQQFVMKWLAEDGLKDVHDSYVQNNADLVEAEQAQFRYNGAMAGLGAALEPMNTAFSNLGATILEAVAPVIEQFVNFILDNMPTIGPIVTGIAAAFGVLATALAIQGIISGVTKAMALLNTTMLANPITLIVAAIAGLVAAFVHFWNTSEGFREFWTNLWEGIKNVFSGIGEWFSEKFTQAKNMVQNAWSGVKNFFGNVRDGINKKFQDVGNWFSQKFTQAKDLAQKAWSGAKDFFGNVRSGINNAFSNVDSWMSSKFGSSWTAVKNAFANSTVAQYFGQIWNSVKGVFSAVKSVLSGNFSDAWEAIKGVFSGWGNFFSGLWDKLKSAFSNAWSNMSEIGKNIVQGLWQGLTNSIEWLKNKITGWVGNVLGFLKNLFGINSPSTETEWQGEMLVAGLVKSLQNGKKKVNAAMQELSESTLDGMNVSPNISTSGGKAAGGKTIIINQTNNSPRALSRREIYRQTHNALSFAGGV